MSQPADPVLRFAAGAGLANFLVAIPLARIAESDDRFLFTVTLGRLAPVILVVILLAAVLVFWSILVVIHRCENRIIRRVAFIAIGALVAFSVSKDLQQQFPGSSLAVFFGLTAMVCVPAFLGWFRAGLVTAALTSPLLLISLWQIESGLTPPAPVGRAAATVVSSRPDVHLMVFDELSLRTMIKDGRLDRAVVPNLARFADRATWYRNAAATFDQTEYAVPAILCGRLDASLLTPELCRDDNVFRLLAPYYQVTLVSDLDYVNPRLHYCEKFADLYSTCVDRERLFYSNDYWAELRDAYLWGILPLSGLYRRIYGRDLVAANCDFPQGSKRVAGIFLSTAPAHDGPPVFNYFHSLMTHHYWFLEADGRIRWDDCDWTAADSGSGGEDFVPTPGLLRDYRAAVSYADRVVGEYLDRLLRAGRLDNALIIITADHGISFDPKAPGRGEGQANDWVVRVPLIVKFPHQDRGKIEDAAVDQLDVLPTILSVTGIGARDRHIGRNLSAQHLGPRPIAFTSVITSPWAWGVRRVKFDVDVKDGIYDKR
jgi:Sulfatase